MSYVAIASGKGSPGVTSLAFAATVLSGLTFPHLVVEADPAGGSLAARVGLGYEPGLIDLAAASRRERPDLEALLRFSQLYREGSFVLPAPASTEQAHAALAAASTAVSVTLASASDVLAVVDLGRVSGRSPALELAKRAAVTLLVCRPRLDEIQHLPAVVDLLRRVGATTELVTLGTRPYDPSEIAAHLGIRLFAVWVDDPTSAEQFWQSPASPGRLARSRWWRTTADIAAAIDDRLMTSPDRSTDHPAPGLKATA